MSLSSHNNLSVGSKKIKKTRQMWGRCFSRVYDWISIYVSSTRLLQTELQNQGGELAIAISGKSHEVFFFLKRRYPEGPGEAVTADLLDNLHLTNFLP